eukprot:scaffold56841_cov30-Tisochrysis_lutea.AAC.2
MTPRAAAASRRGWTAPVVYLGSMACFTAVALDEYFDLRKWKRVSHTVREPHSGELLSFSLRARRRPPPIGCMDWPAGRALLEWVAADGLHRPFPGTTNTVLEIGSGVGTTAIGLALLSHRTRDQNDAPSAVQVIASDVCGESLSNLCDNAKASGILPVQSKDLVSTSLASDPLLVTEWDAASGASALPANITTRLTHIIGADVVYAGGADGVLFERNLCASQTVGSPEGVGRDAQSDRAGLARTLHELLSIAPNAEVRLMLVNRFAGGAVATLAAVANVPVKSTIVDPSLSTFEEACRKHGLRVEISPVPSDVVRSLNSALPISDRLLWFLSDTWSALVCYRIYREELTSEDSGLKRGVFDDSLSLSLDNIRPHGP